jgi:hypothetical protein
MVVARLLTRRKKLLVLITLSAVIYFTVLNAIHHTSLKTSSGEAQQQAGVLRLKLDTFVQKENATESKEQENATESKEQENATESKEQENATETQQHEGSSLRTEVGTVVQKENASAALNESAESYQQRIKLWNYDEKALVNYTRLPLTKLLNKNGTIVEGADLQSLLDFAIIGFGESRISFYPHHY